MMGMEWFGALAAVTPIVPALFAAIIPLVSTVTKRYSVVGGLAVVASLISLVISSLVLSYVQGAGEPLVYAFGGWPPPLGVVYEVDYLGAVLGLMTTFLAFLCVLYSYPYMKDTSSAPYYYSLILLLEASIVACFYTGDVFNLFVMIELVGVTSYSLVAYRRWRGRALEASFKYGLAVSLAGVMYFVALAFTYGYFGTLNMADLACRLRCVESAFSVISGPGSEVLPAAVGLILALATWSFLLESAVFPLHFWLPDAHSEALTPVSAVLSGLVVNVGVYAVARFSYTLLGLGAPHSCYVGRYVLLVVSVAASAGAIYASVAMLFQDDVKRLIAYSTVLHMSLVALGVSSVTESGLAASTYHILTHGVSKVLAFLAVGVMIEAYGTRSLSKLGGAGRKYPLAMVAAAVAFMSLAGIPPFATFPSKVMLFTAMLDSKCLWGAGAIVASSAVAAIAYFRAMQKLWLGEGATEARETPLTRSPLAKAVLAILVILCLVLGAAISPIADYAVKVANAATNLTYYIEPAKQLLTSYLAAATRP